MRGNLKALVWGFAGALLAVVLGLSGWHLWEDHATHHAIVRALQQAQQPQAQPAGGTK